MARVLINHGLANRRWQDHWQRHLANALRKQGHLVSYAQFPNPDKPTLEEWQAMLNAEAELLIEAGEQAGSEFVPLVSAALLVSHEHAFPYVDLRVDSDPQPIARLRALWQEYQPMADLYVTRAIDPDSL
jgi:uncharacterized Ntn-hydrolase superfamily protein